MTNLVALLVAAAGRPIGDTPWLDEVLSGDQTVPVSDGVLAAAADRLGVPRRTARRAVPASQLFVVPEEANQFTDFGGQAPPRRPRRKASKLPLLLAVGATAAAAVVIGVLLSSRGGKPPDDAGPPPPPVVDNKGPGPAGRAGLVDTKWVNFPSAPRAPTAQSLGSGIDVAPPGSKTVRSFPARGAAALGAWLRPDGTRAIIVGHAQVATLDLGTGAMTPLPKLPGEAVRAAVTPDGRYGVIAGKDRSIRCIEMGTGQAIWTTTFSGPVTALVVTPDGERVAASGEKVGYSSGASPTGRRSAGTSCSRRRSWRSGRTGRTRSRPTRGGSNSGRSTTGRQTQSGPGFAATAVCFSADGEQALAAGVGQNVRAWAVADGRELPGRPALLRRG